MADTVSQAPAASAAKAPFNLTRLLVVVGVIAVIGVVMILRFAEAQRERDLYNWQVKLNLIADSRVREVNGWVEAQFKEMRALSQNASLQLYVTQLQTMGSAGDDPSEKIYLNNLILFTAERGGFGTGKDSALSEIPANIMQPIGDGGIAVIDNDGKVIVATKNMPPIEGDLQAQLTKQKAGQTILLDMWRNPAGLVQMGFAVPVFAIQGDDDAASQIGRVVGIKSISDELYGLLKHPGVTEKTLESVLVRIDKESVVNLSPLADGSKPLEKRFARGTSDLDYVYAVTSPSSFAEKRDYDFKSVLMTSRQVSGAPWSLMVKIDREEALKESDAWISRLTAVLMLAMLLAIAVIVAAWWYGTSKRALQLSIQSDRLASAHAAKEKLLKVVSDNQPEPIFITDYLGKLWFANDKAARAMGADADELMGKDLGSVIGQATAKDYLDASKSALDMDRAVSRVERYYEGNTMRIIRSEHIPLAHVPIETLSYPTPGTLVVDQDITDIVSERERRSQTLKQIIDTLIKMVDARDPYSANHSAMVAMIAREMALEMGLNTTLAETAEIAGNLMNIGKMVVPSEVLTKTAALNENEIGTIRHSLSQSADLLEGIAFDGPVVDTLRQAQEHWDGTGPQGLEREDILVSARIIAVANTFIGMVSPRSYRAAIPVDQALKLLLEDIEARFDRRAVVALVNYIENKGGRAELAKLAPEQKKSA